MTDVQPRPSSRLDSPLEDALIGAGKFFTRGEVSADNRAVFKQGGGSDWFYRDRWAYDKVVRSTHGVNCTGSCSWKVYVKDGIITWEAQQTDYPSVGPDKPEYEPRGCPRGAAFSWYTYSPTRVRYPYMRGVLLEMYRQAKAEHGDPVLAWASIVQDPEKAKRYKSARGKGGLVRATWEEAVELVAAAQVYTIKRWGPDRIAGFSPIPAMSMVSHASGARFTSLIGGTMLSFYDWYADLPVASPQVFGDQTDVPESGDWWDAGYLIMWGSNVPLTRTPDAHWMTEARYRGQKVVAMSPDYAENVKFADEWLPVAPGTDAALGMAMGHVVLKEFFVDKQVPYFEEYTRAYTDLPFLVTLDQASSDGEGTVYRPGKNLVAGDFDNAEAGSENAMFKPALWDTVTDAPAIPNGTLGHRFGDEGMGKWNLDLGDLVPALTLQAAEAGSSGVAEVELPLFDSPDGEPTLVRRGVPVRRIGDRLVTTVFDLMLAQYGVGRPGLPGDWPTGYDDETGAYTPAWQEAITNVQAHLVTRVAREFAQNAADTRGRSMILMGGGTNHWYHSDLIYRTMMMLTTITGCQGRNGGGWAHYVGQEKARPITGWAQMAFGLDWSRPPRQMIQTGYWYINTNQWRHDTFDADVLAAGDAGNGLFKNTSTADLFAQSARSGWMPSYPTFDRNPLTLADDVAASGKPVGEYVAQSLKDGSLKFAVEDPDAEENWPRVLMLWRANLFGNSAKGDEYFLKHLLGTDNAVTAAETPEHLRPQHIRWRDEAPQGKLDLVLTLDFRSTSSTLMSDVILPAATWYEKHDINTTDMHPFVHPFTPAINPPWQSKTDWETFALISNKFSELARTHLGTRTDVVAVPLMHDSPDAMATPHGIVADWKTGEVAPVPGVTMPKLVLVERDYTTIGEKYGSVGPLLDKLGTTTKAVTVDVNDAITYLKGKNGVRSGGVADGRPKLDNGINVAEAIMGLAGTTNGHLATQGFKTLEKRTGTQLHDLAAEHEGKIITFNDIVSQPTPVITSPEWSGSESGGRRYSPFTINVERLKPWHTLTGRQHFYLDHDWMDALGEKLPTYRGPLNMTQLFGETPLGETNELGVSVRYLTPHFKWAIHSQYQDNWFMQNLSRGGQQVWMSVEDAQRVGIDDNDWIELVNRNGVVAARAIVSHRMPKGTVYMYHSQDRLIDVPLTETNGRRGGIHNSMTRILIKPSHIIGGYAQLAFAFNYLGPTGNNRDEVTMLRKRTAPLAY
ncbi:nitrate reductase subunit alpha [Propionibacteriaceae bacterium G1746]|uniref:nitrate reductase subunit alpha n=1 Tax=Aestuariimicrobium sp. G57 TaxID=3418485 RepID=UPI003C171E18